MVIIIHHHAMSSPEYINNAIKVYTSFEYVQQLLWEDCMHHILYSFVLSRSGIWSSCNIASYVYIYIATLASYVAEAS